MPLVNMKKTKKEVKDDLKPTIAVDVPKYPYGLSINLEEESLVKLDMTDLPEVGDSMNLIARVTVESVQSSERQGGKKHRSLHLQITDLALEADNKGKIKTAAEELYGDK